MAPAPRIASMLASATEIVFALGFGEQLVARSHECDYPEEVKKLPVVTAPKFPVDGSSAEIDARVKGILENATSVYKVDAARLDELRPDFVVTQTQCEVCAVSQRDVEDALAQMVRSKPKLVALSPNCLEDVFADIRRVATALGEPARGDWLVGAMGARIDIVRRLAALESASTRAPGNAARPSIACIEWIEPLMAAGNWMPELVALAGGENLFGEAGKHSPWMTFAELAARDPEVILVTPCGFDIPRTLTEMPLLAKQEGWSGLRAVRAGRVYVGDGNQYFNRPGPRLVESLEILAEVLHPDVFDFGQRGRGYVTWPEA